mgnify:CR=1 FL=1
MSKLDEYQMKVVNETGHCLVIAGPGSGKSTTICEKVKTLIANGTNESEILLISFTNKSVDDLKKKLGSDIFITTFHRLAIDILKYNKINYQICCDTLLDYIIEEYLMTIKDKEKLCRYLNITKLDKGKNEYISLKKLIKTFINLFKIGFTIFIGEANPIPSADVIFTVFIPITSPLKLFLIYFIFMKKKKIQQVV